MEKAYISLVFINMMGVDSHEGQYTYKLIVSPWTNPIGNKCPTTNSSLLKTLPLC